MYTKEKEILHTDTCVVWKESCVEWKKSKDLKSVLSTGTLFVSKEQGTYVNVLYCFIVIIIFLS